MRNTLTYTDYPELVTGWNKRMCTLARNLPWRLAVFTMGNSCPDNPYALQEHNALLTGYYPVTAFQEKGALKLKKGYANVITPANTSQTQNLGTQVENSYHCLVLDLSSEQVRSSGRIETWTVRSRADIEVVFVVNSPPFNYFEFLHEVIEVPKLVGLRNP